MSTFRLLWESVLYYWRTNLAVLLGVIAGTAVIGGALIVGDSVRGSLETMSRERLGQIDYAMSGHRFVREVALRSKNSDSGRRFPIAPALVMIGAVERRLNPSQEEEQDNIPNRVCPCRSGEYVWSGSPPLEDDRTR